ncbi:MAG: hypothetical protein R3Y68_05445 [Rikenellaceae bacterium]
MKSFDIEKIGKKMPYAAPEADFFDTLTHDTIARVERESRRRRLLRGAATAVSAITSIAAAIAIYVNVSHPTSEEQMFQNYDKELDVYVANLSDDELSTLFYDMEIEGDFYSNL